MRRTAWIAVLVAGLFVPPAAAEDATPLPDLHFGSYGRATLHFDADGNAGRDTNVIGHGPRIFEPSYAELEFRKAFRGAEELRRCLQRATGVPGRSQEAGTPDRLSL